MEPAALLTWVLQSSLTGRLTDPLQWEGLYIIITAFGSNHQLDSSPAFPHSAITVLDTQFKISRCLYNGAVSSTAFLEALQTSVTAINV